MVEYCKLWFAIRELKPPSLFKKKGSGLVEEELVCNKMEIMIKKANDSI